MVSFGKRVCLVLGLVVVAITLLASVASSSPSGEDPSMLIAQAPRASSLQGSRAPFSANANRILWVHLTAKAYGLSEEDVKGLLASGMTEQEAPDYLERLYPHEPFTIGTGHVVDLAMKLGVEPEEILRAYGIAARFGVGVEAVIHLRGRGAIEWDRVEGPLGRLKEVRKRLDDFRKGAPPRKARLAFAIASTYGASQHAASMLCDAGLSEEEILTFLFLVDAPTPQETARDLGQAIAGAVAELRAAPVASVKAELGRRYADLKLSGPWKPRKFPGKLEVPTQRSVHNAGMGVIPGGPWLPAQGLESGESVVSKPYPFAQATPPAGILQDAGKPSPFGQLQPFGSLQASEEGTGSGGRRKPVW